MNGTDSDIESNTYSKQDNEKITIDLINLQKVWQGWKQPETKNKLLRKNNILSPDF